MEDKERRQQRMGEFAEKLASLLAEYDMELIVQEAGMWDRYCDGIAISDDYGEELDIGRGTTVSADGIRQYLLDN